MTQSFAKPMPSLTDQAKTVVRVVYRHRVLAGSLGAIVVALFFVYALVATKQYASGVTMMAQSDTSLSTLPAMASDGAGGLGGLSILRGGAAPLDRKLLNILRSRDLFFTVVKETDLLQVMYEDKWDPETGTWKGGEEPSLHEAYLTRWGRVYSAFVDEENYAVKFNITTPYPEKSYELANAVLAELQHLLSQKTSRNATKTRAFLDERLAQLDQEMDDAEAALQAFQLKHQIYIPESQIAGALDLITTLESQRMANEIQLGVLSRYAQESNPKIRAIRDEIEEIDAKIEEIREGPGDKKGTGPAPLIPALEQTPALMQDFIRLKRQVLIFEKLTNLLRAEYEFARLKEQKEDLSFIVIDSPIVPTKRAKPKRKLIVVVGLFLASLLATGSALVAEYVPIGWRWVKRAAKEDKAGGEGDGAGDGGSGG